MLVWLEVVQDAYEQTMKIAAPPMSEDMRIHFGVGPMSSIVGPLPRAIIWTRKARIRRISPMRVSPY
jgi:hypothetical protein